MFYFEWVHNIIISTQVLKFASQLITNLESHTSNDILNDAISYYFNIFKCFIYRYIIYIMDYGL